MTTTSTIRVRPFGGSAAEWNDFVCAQAEATLYHDFRWREVIETFFGYPSLYLEARADERLVGVLPLFRVRHGLLQTALVSMPFLNYGGPVAVTEPARVALLDHAGGLATETGAQYLELRCRRPQGAEFLTSTHKETYELALDGGHEVVWRQLESSVRNKIRKALKQGVVVRTGCDQLPHFYRCYAHNMRDLGTPVLGRGFFERILAVFPEACEVMSAHHDGRVIGGKFVMMWGGVTYFIWASSLRSALRLAPNDLLNWSAIEQACARGMRICDFGRSSVGSSHSAYKRQWRARSHQLYWEYRLAHPDAHANPADDRQGRLYRYASALWRHVPHAVAGRVGPYLAKYLP